MGRGTGASVWECAREGRGGGEDTQVSRLLRACRERACAKRQETTEVEETEIERMRGRALPVEGLTPGEGLAGFAD